MYSIQNLNNLRYCPTMFWFIVFIPVCLSVIFSHKVGSTLFDLLEFFGQFQDALI